MSTSRSTRVKKSRRASGQHATGRRASGKHATGQECSAEDLGYNQFADDKKEMNQSQTRMSNSSSSRGKKSRRTSGQHAIGEDSHTGPTTRRGPSSRLDRSSLSHGRKRSKDRKAKRRGSTSVLEVTSSTNEDPKQPMRREESLPPRNKRDRQSSLSKSKSPKPRTRSSLRSALDTSKSAARSRGASERRGRKGNDPESSRRDKLSRSKKSSSRRMLASESPAPRSKSPKDTKQQMAKVSDGGKTSKRTGTKSSLRKSNHGNRRSSVPTSSTMTEPEAKERRKSRPKSSRRQSELPSMSQSQPINAEPATLKKGTRRTKSMDRNRKDGSLKESMSPRSQAKSPKVKTKRRLSLNGASALESHIVAPGLPKTSQSSMSGMTHSTAKSDEPGVHRYKPALPKRTSSWSSELDLI